LVYGLAALVLSGCDAVAKPDPEALYNSIHLDLLHGSLDVARSRAELARRQFSAGNTAGGAAWELEFRLLEAEILQRQQHPKEVVGLLTGNVAFPASGELAIKRHLISGRAHGSLGDLEQAERELHEAQRLAELVHSPLIGEVLRAEALRQRESGQWEEAREKLRSSLAVAREHGNALLEADDRVDIGYDSLHSEHYDQALLLSQEAATFAGSVQARRQLQYALGNIGWAYMNLGDFENALANFQAAEHQAHELAVVNSRVLWLQDAGLADCKLGNFREARKYEEQALELALTLPSDRAIDQVANIQTNLALLLYDQGQYDEAKTYSQQAMSTARNSKDDTVVAYAGFIDSLISTHLASGADAERRLMQAWQLTRDSETRMEIENALARFHANRHESRQAELWYRRSIDTFEHNRASVRDEGLRLTSFAYGDSVYRDYADFLIDSHRPSEALQLLDRSRARTLSEGLGLAEADVDTSGKRAPDAQATAGKLGALILYYSLGPERSYLWAISAHDVHLFVLPGDRDIRALVAEYQRVIQQSIDPLQTGNPAAVSLYSALVEPAAAMIPAGSKVFVVPDGVLHGLNFETLLEPAGAGFKYWIEDVTVTTTGSIRMLSRLSAIPQQEAARGLLLIGNPISVGSEFEALPQAAAEIRSVRQHFPADAATVLVQEDAVPAAYAASDPDRYQYIHFVAHGTASRMSPLDSAVVLSPGPADPGNFKLYAREIVRHPLHARLVTISACYGSGLRTYAGEGLVGLAWAFLRAGSHNVIGALWQADDASTPLIMGRLYTQIEAGRSPDEALREAKLVLIHSANVYRKPFYWGVFQLYAGS
jgi:CHAT domain-containing protein/Flp pilus assembly protein TadD